MSVERLVTAEEMKALDKYTIEEIGVPSMVLMERAALASFNLLMGYEVVTTGGDRFMAQDNFDLTKTVVFCGPGNNGGDGIAVARLLQRAGKAVLIVMVGDLSKMTEDAKQQQKIAENYGVEFMSFKDFAVKADATVCDGNLGDTFLPDISTIVDAIFGIGGDRAAHGEYLDAIRLINTLSENAKVLSLDTPSGVSADTGATLGDAVKADFTITFAYNKIGLTTARGFEKAGKIVIADIGIY